MYVQKKIGDTRTAEKATDVRTPCEETRVGRVREGHEMTDTRRLVEEGGSMKRKSWADAHYRRLHHNSLWYRMTRAQRSSGRETFSGRD